MTVSLLIITHNGIGDAFMESIAKTLGNLPLQTKTISVTYDTDPEIIANQAKQAAKGLESGHGLLILTDLFGSTPSNIARRLCNGQGVEIISGLNYPMLLRVMNYPDLNLSQLAQKAISGGRDGILACEDN